MSPTKPAATWFAFVYSVFLCLKPENAVLNKASCEASFRSFSSKTPWEQPRHSVKYRISSVSSSFAGSILYKGSMFSVVKKIVFFSQASVLMSTRHFATLMSFGNVLCSNNLLTKFSDFFYFSLTKWTIGQTRFLCLLTLFCQVTFFYQVTLFGNWPFLGQVKHFWPRDAFWQVTILRPSDAFFAKWRLFGQVTLFGNWRFFSQVTPFWASNAFWKLKIFRPSQAVLAKCTLRKRRFFWLSDAFQAKKRFLPKWRFFRLVTHWPNCAFLLTWSSMESDALAKWRVPVYIVIINHDPWLGQVIFLRERTLILWIILLRTLTIDWGLFKSWLNSPAP